MVEEGALGIYLSCCINDFGSKVLRLEPYDFTESVLDSRVITLHKMAVNELDCERRFSF